MENNFKILRHFSITQENVYRLIKASPNKSVTPNKSDIVNIALDNYFTKESEIKLLEMILSLFDEHSNNDIKQLIVELKENYEL